MRGVCIFLLLCILSNPLKAQVNLSNGLVAYYPFNGNANDASGNNHHGQLLNGLQLAADRFGNLNSAYLFDGINDYIKVSDNGSFSTPNFSLVIWFQSQSDNLQNLVGKRDFTTVGGTAGAQYQFFINYPPFPGIGSNLVGNNSSCSNIASSSYINTSEWICRSKWYCAVVTFDGSRHKIYIDGVLKKDEATTFNGFLACSSDLRFGNWWQGDLIPFKGLMDDIRWYNRTLNQQEVMALYANYPNISGQCSSTAGAGFLTPDTVCVNTQVTITNTSVGASSYYWNFCLPNSATNPLGTNLGNFGFALPGFSDYAKDGNNYYVFVTNYTAGKLIRLDFGNSLLNTPTQFDFGNLGGVIPDQCEGIQIVKNGGKWYAIIVGGQPVGRIVKVDFGTSLSNNSPIATNWGNIGSLAYPTDLHVFQDGSNWYGLTINAQTNSITRFNFSASFNNTPTGVNLGNIGGMNYPTGIYAISKNNNWYAFISNAGNGVSNSSDASLTRLNFGNSLLNTPTGANLGNPGNALSSSRDLTIYQSCNEIFGFVVNNASSKEIVRLNFNNSLTSVPTATILGNTGSLNFPHSVSKLFRADNDLYAFITNVNNNTLTRLKFGGCSNASISSSTLQNPPPITYNAVGTYSINLTVDDGLPTQSAYCKTVVVIDNTHSPTQNKSICAGDSVLLTSTKASGNLWNTGSSSNSIYAKIAGTYWVQSSAGGCTNVDSFIVSVTPSPTVNLGIDTSICTIDSLVLNAGNAGSTFAWQNGQATQTFVVTQDGLYHVTVSTNGCLAKDSILITDLPSPVLSLSNDTTICKTNQVNLIASGADFYSWTPTTGLSSSTNAITIASPDTTTKYYVTATNTNTCTTKDSVTVTIVPKPVVNIGPDTSLCTLDSLLLDAGNSGALFTWQNGQSTQTFLVKQDGVYHVDVNKDGCIVRDSVLISELASPVISLSDDTAICKTGSVILSASGGDFYSWSPAIGLSNSATAITTANPDTTTTYYLTVTNANSCIATDSITVTVIPNPVVNIGPDTSLCSRDSLVLDAGNTGATFAWQNGQATQTFLVRQDGLYHVSVNSNGCIVTDSILISPLPSPVINVSDDTAICKTSTATLWASGGDAYSWFPTRGLSDSISTIIIASPDTTTKYYVVVTSSNNCQAKDSVTITVNPKPQFAIQSSKPVVCTGDTVLLSASGGDSYVWSPSLSLSDPFSDLTAAFPTATTLYKVVIEHNGCNVKDSLLINLPVADKPLIALSKSNDINCFQGQATLTAGGGSRYLWRPSTGLSDSTSKNPVATLTQSTTFRVLITTADGCVLQDSITVNVDKGDDGSGFPVPSAFTPNRDGKNDCFGVKYWGTVTEFSFNLYNRWGELIFHADDPSQCWNGIYKGVLQPSDVYVYWIKAKTRCGDVLRKGTFALIR